MLRPPPLKPVETGQNFSQVHFNRFEIKTADWKHLCHCNFGENRKSGVGEWNGDAFQYDIYESEFYGRRSVGLRCWNGMECLWLVAEDIESRANMLDMIRAIPEEPKRWDACHFLYKTVSDLINAVEQKTISDVKKAFVEGRLKKRKIRNSNVVEVIIKDREFKKPS